MICCPCTASWPSYSLASPLHIAVSRTALPSLNSYPHLVESGISRESRGGHRREPRRGGAEAARRRLPERAVGAPGCFDLQSSHGRASSDLATIERAATYGAVETLLVDIDEKVPGFVEEESGTVTALAGADAVHEFPLGIVTLGDGAPAIRPTGAA